MQHIFSKYPLLICALWLSGCATTIATQLPEIAKADLDQEQITQEELALPADKAGVKIGDIILGKGGVSYGASDKAFQFVTIKSNSQTALQLTPLPMAIPLPSHRAC